MVCDTYTSRDPCAACKEINLPITIEQKIEGAPAMLRVCLRIMGDDRIWNPWRGTAREDRADSPVLKRLGYLFNKDKAQWGRWTEHKWKNINPVEIPTILDLADLQVEDEVPLRYQLSSVISHTGNDGTGHWIAAARAEDAIFSISNHNVLKKSEEYLRANPQLYGGAFQAGVLTYIRIPMRRP